MNSRLFLSLLVAVAPAAFALKLEVLEDSPYRVYDDTDYPLTCRFTFNLSDPLEVLEMKRIEAKNLTIAIRPSTEMEWQLDFKNDSIGYSAQEIVRGINKTFVFSSFWWGYSDISLEGKGTALRVKAFLEKLEELGESTDAESDDSSAEMDLDWQLLNNETEVITDRKPLSKAVDMFFVIGGTSFMLVNTVNMGCQLDLHIIWSVLKKPIGPLCGVVSQFICMPIFSFSVGYLLLTDPLQRLGLFTLGCSPGGNLSNFWTLLFHGDVNLSITMTFCSTIIAMGMMPFWMAVLGQRLVQDTNIKVPFKNLILSLLMLSFPVAIGLVIKYKKPRWAKFSGMIVKPMTFCMIVFLITVGLYSNYKSFGMMTWNVVVAGLSVSFAGYVAGASLSAACCLRGRQIIAISIETAFQNAVIAFILLKISLPTPDSDLATVPILAQMVQTGPPLMVIFITWQILQRTLGVCVITDDDEPTKKDEEAKGEGEVKTGLMEMTDKPIEVPHTPGLLFDPSKPECLKDNPAVGSKS